MRKNLLKCLWLLCLIMTAQVGWAGEWNGNTVTFPFTNYSNGFNFAKGSSVVNSSGRTMDILVDETYDALEDRFAITGNTGTYEENIGTDGKYKGRWYANGNGLTNNHTGDRYLSILNLKRGDKVTITYTNGSWTSGGESHTSDIRFASDGQANNQSANNSVVSASEYEKTNNGSLDLIVGRYCTISKIVITLNENYWGFEDNSGSQKYRVADVNNLPCYRVRFSSRWFDEPTLVKQNWAIITYSVENYGSSVGNKNVAVMNTDPNYVGDLMFVNLGMCKVKATNQYGDYVEYLVEVWDNEAYYEIDELEDGTLKYKFKRNPDPDLGEGDQGGVLFNRVIKAIPGIEMKVGIPAHDQYDYVNNTQGLPGGLGGQWDQDHDNSDNHYIPNTAAVTKYALNDGDHFVTWVNDDNGWWDRTPHNDYTWPYQGTYFQFTATANGTLKFGGVKLNDGTGKVYIVNLSDPFAADARTDIVSAGNGYIGYFEGTIEMKAGDMYMLHGDAGGASGWAPFGIEWFSFDGGFKMSEHYGVTALTGFEIKNNGSVDTREKIESKHGTQGINVEVVENGYKGHIQSANVSLNSDGSLHFSNITFTSSKKDNMGGAIKVKLSMGSNISYYVLTIPYGQHVWDFRQTSENAGDGDFSYAPAEVVNMMKANSTEWRRVYKVHRRIDGEWKNLIDPIMAVNGRVEGNNAFYMTNTNGLVFEVNTEGFGTGEVSNQNGSTYVKDHGLDGIDDEVEYGYDYTTVTGGDLLWMKGNGATIKFPGVKAGQYIKFYMYRHSDDKGETYVANNLVDLDNVAYDGETTFRLRGIPEPKVPNFRGNEMKGVAMFKVPADYSPTNDLDAIPSITLTDDGWSKIYRIEILDEYKSDLHMTMATDEGNVPVDYDGICSSIVVRKSSDGTATPVTKNFLAISANTGCLNANTCEYEVIPDEGVDISYEHKNWVSNGGVDYTQLNITFNGGNGLVKIIQREKVNTAGFTAVPRGETVSGQFEADGYVVDKNIYYIAVGELKAQEYPFTWDFDIYNMYQGNSTTKTGMTGSTDDEYGKWNADSEDEDNFGQQDKVVVDFEDADEIAENATVNKQLFAQGAQLTTGGTNGQSLIVEAEGLGVKRPYGADKEYHWYTTVDGTYGKQTLNYKAYDLEEDGINFDGEALNGVGEITIPEVGKDMYVFVMANAAPSKVLINNAVATKLEKFDSAGGDIPSGVYVYQNTGNAADVVLNFASSTSIKKIGVTDITKSLNKLGYATESRNHAIDHTYTGIFTNNDANAYGVMEYGTGDYVYQYKGYTMVNRTAEITVVPENTGVVLYKEGGADDRFNVPLFVPACNVVPTENDLATLEDNWMAPNVKETSHTTDVVTKARAMGDHYTGDDGGLVCIKFVMTTKGITYNGNSHSSTDVEREVETECFYRMILSGTEKDKLGDNKAYLLVPKGDIPYAVWDSQWDGHSGFANTFFLDLNIEDLIEGDLDGISTIASDNNSGEQVYYTIDGTRINGKPTAKGVYICNGKKVMVK